MANQPTNESETIDSNDVLSTSSDLECLLPHDIRSLLHDKCDAQPRSSMLVFLNRLMVNLPVFLKFSSNDGYLSILLKNRPSCSRQIDKLYQANLECISSLESIQGWLEIVSPMLAISKEVELRLMHWKDSFSAMCRESVLWQEAFVVDLGGEA